MKNKIILTLIVGVVSLGLFSLFLIIYIRFSSNFPLNIYSVEWDENTLENVSPNFFLSFNWDIELENNTESFISKDYFFTVLSSPEKSLIKEILFLYTSSLSKRDTSKIFSIFISIKDFFLRLVSKKISFLETQMFFQKGVEEFVKRDFKEAEVHFRKVIYAGTDNKYINIAKIYLSYITYFYKLREEIDSVINKINITSEPKILERMYYSLGILWGELGDYKKAKEYISYAQKFRVDERIYQKSLFLLGYINKLMKNYEEARRIFEEFLKDYPDSSYKQVVYFQLGDIFSREKKFKESAEYYFQYSMDYPNDKLTPISLLFSLDNYYKGGFLDDAQRVYRKLMEEYPTSFLVKDFLSRYQFLWNEGTIKKKELEDKTILMWQVEPFRTILELVEQGAVLYALYMIEGSFQQAILQKKDQGDNLTIEVDEEFLTNWVNYRLKIFAQSYKHLGLSFSNFRIYFPYKGWVVVKGIVSLGKYNWEGYAAGKMYIRDIYEEEFYEYKGKKWVVFDIEEARLGDIIIPVDLIDRAIRKAEIVFNTRQVFDIEYIDLNPSITIWQGKVRYRKEELPPRLEEIKNLIENITNFKS